MNPMFQQQETVFFGGRKFGGGCGVRCVSGVFGEVGEITDEFGSFSFISFTMLLGYIAFKVSRRFQLYPSRPR